MCVDDLWPMYSLRYTTLLQKHKHLIRGQFFGHEHYNEFRVMRECAFTEPNPASSGVQNCGGTPFAVTYIAQCMSNCRDPGVRLWTIDQDYTLVDYNQYGKVIGGGPDSNWTLRYNFKDVYGKDMPNMSAPSHQAEIDRMAADPDRFAAFMKRRMEDSTGSVSSCDETCKRFQLCNMSFGNLAEFLQCVYSGYKAMATKVTHGLKSITLGSDLYNEPPDVQPLELIPRAVMVSDE